jgi:hypothetical protein
MILFQVSSIIYGCLFLATVVVNGLVRFGAHDPSIQEETHHRQLHSIVHDVKRFRVMSLPEGRPEPAVGELIEFELFDGHVALADVTSVVTRGVGETSWMGRARMSSGEVEKDLLRDEGHFALTCVEKSCIANIQMYKPNVHYRITPANTVLTSEGEGMYALTEVHLSPERKSGVNVTAIAMEQRRKVMENRQLKTQSSVITEAVSPTPAPTTKPDTDLIMDILVFYTPRSLASNFGGR